MQVVELSEEDADRYLDQWREVAAKYAGTKQRGGQELIEPYILEKTLHDRPGRLIIATVEGKQWYDHCNPTELLHLLRLGMIRRGDTVFDCGANQGVYSLLFAHAVGRTGRVVAFDPFPLNCDIGRFNADMNEVRNIDFVQAGLAESAHALEVATADQCVGIANAAADDAVKINLVPLDMFARLKPSFVKIDIEGAEVNALEGAKEVLALEPAVYIEVHPGFLPLFGRTPMEIFKHIDLDRYTCLIDHPNVPSFAEYRQQFEIIEGCSLYFLPKSRPALSRRFRSAPPPPKARGGLGGFWRRLVSRGS